ncbi:MAG TPA: ribosome-associated translation inhibitor RaiA [Bryobacteraceae bacterium]|nr:ribosome-associated translation inhibitor RaiA [Bryobacteraceae bacterium]
MKVTYTGRHIELSPPQAQKVEEQFRKVGKLLDNGRGEAEARVVLAHERHLNNVEVTVAYHNHELIGQASDADLFSALRQAVEKLEAQALKVRAKWREGFRVPRETAGEESEA